MKKVIAITILLAVVFFYRQELLQYTHVFFITEEEPFEWVRFRSENLYPKLPAMDFMSATNALQEFQEDIENGLAELEKQDNAESRTFRRRLECELAVVYRQTAAQYLQQGDDENYMTFMQKTQEQVRVCSELNAPTT